MAHGAAGRQRQLLDFFHAALADPHEGDGFLHPALVQMVAERRTRVAHGVDADALGAVDMAERRIAEARKPRCIDGIHRADGQGRGLAAGELRRADAGDHHLVGDEHPARGGGLTDGQRRADGGVVVGDVGVGQVVAHRGRPHKGQQRELDGTVAVIEYDLLGAAGETPGNVYVLFGQQAAGKVEPLGAVVVAGDGQHRDAAGGQLGQEPVQQGAGGGGGHGGVVNIARQHHGVHLIAVTQR